MEFRPLTDLEAGILKRLLAVDHWAYADAVSQISELMAAPVSDWGTIALCAHEDGAVKPRSVDSALPYIGVMKDIDGVPIQFVVLIDGGGRISELEITKLDGSAIRGPILPELIEMRLREPGMKF